MESLKELWICQGISQSLEVAGLVLTAADLVLCVADIVCRWNSLETQVTSQQQ